MINRADRDVGNRVKEMNRTVAHKRLGHCDDVWTEATAKKLGYRMKGTYVPCESCMTSKMHQKKYAKSARIKKTETEDACTGISAQ